MPSIGLYDGVVGGAVVTLSDGSFITTCNDASQVHVLTSGRVALNLYCAGVAISGGGDFYDADSAAGDLSAVSIEGSGTWEATFALNGGVMEVNLSASGTGTLGSTPVGLVYEFAGTR